MPTVEQPFSLPHAILSLYMVDSDGSVLTADPLYLGAPVDNFRAVQQLEQVKTWPTGRRFPVVHHVGESHEISIGRVWLTKQDFDPVNPNDDPWEFIPIRNQTLAMVVAWQREEDLRWVARIYWEVTANGDDLANHDVAEFIQGNSFTAQYFTRKNGIGAVCPV